MIQSLTARVLIACLIAGLSMVAAELFPLFGWVLGWVAGFVFWPIASTLKSSSPGHVPPKAMPQPTRPAPPMPECKPPKDADADYKLICEIKALTYEITQLRKVQSEMLRAMDNGGQMIVEVAA